MSKTHTKLPDTSSDKCHASGSCGGPGLCPGIALFIAFIVGSAITVLTGLEWLGWSIGVPLALILFTGAWRWLPTYVAKSAKGVDNAS